MVKTAAILFGIVFLAVGILGFVPGITTDQMLLGKMHLVANKIAKDLNLPGYRLVLNCEESAGQSVPHLHLHLLGGRALSWPPG